VEIETFPVLDALMSVEQGLQTLRSADRSALVVRNGGAYGFVNASSLVFAKADQTAVTLRELGGTPPIVPVMLAEIPNMTLDFSAPQAALEFENYLDRKKLEFVILATTYSQALIASRHESAMVEKRASPRDCYCKTDGKPVVSGTHHGNCPYDPTHVGTVRCV
jgi:hypothetical protein